MKDYVKKRIIILSVVVLVLVGIALAVFFCFPRNPDVEFGDPTYSNVTNTNTLFSLTVQIPFTVDNPNYYEIKMKKLDLDVEYRDIFIYNFIEEDDYHFKKRGQTDSIISATISTRDTSVIPLIQSDLNSDIPLRMKFHGKAKLEALKITISHGISFTRNILIVQ